MGVDVYFYLRAWKKDGTEIKVQDYVSFTGEQNSILSTSNKYVGRAYIHNSDFAYKQITKAELNGWIRENITEFDGSESIEKKEECLKTLFPGESLYQTNLRKINKKKWLSKHVDGYITRDEYVFEEYEEEGLENNCISTWYLEDEIDTSSNRFVHVNFDVVDPFAIQRAKLIEEYLRIEKILMEKADLDRNSVRLYMYYSS